jgi:hypothetical protein
MASRKSRSRKRIPLVPEGQSAIGVDVPIYRLVSVSADENELPLRLVGLSRGVGGIEVATWDEVSFGSLPALGIQPETVGQLRTALARYEIARVRYQLGAPIDDDKSRARGRRYGVKSRLAQIEKAAIALHEAIELNTNVDSFLAHRLLPQAAASDPYGATVFSRDELYPVITKFRRIAFLARKSLPDFAATAVDGTEPFRALVLDCAKVFVDAVLPVSATKISAANRDVASPSLFTQVLVRLMFTIDARLREHVGARPDRLSQERMAHAAAEVLKRRKMREGNSAASDG